MKDLVYTLYADICNICHINYISFVCTGPAAYNLPTPTCPGILIGEKLHVEHDPLYPAPNQYTISDSVYNKQAKSFGIKSNIDTGSYI